MTAAPPPWLPFVLLALLALGWRQSRPRTVHPAGPLAVALAMGVFSLHGVIGTFGLDAVALLAWATGAIAAVALGAQAAAGRGLQADGARVRVPGSWTPMALLMTVFAAKVVLGVAVTVHAGVLHTPSFVAATCGVLGAASGLFGARAMAVLRCARARRV